MRYCIIFILMVAFAGCNKRVTCHSTFYDVGAQFAFKGFSTQELDTIVLRQYPADGRFAQLLDDDTLIPPNVIFRTDTALHTGGNGFFPIGEGRDYEVVLPAAARTFRITGITTYHEDNAYESDDDGHCYEKTSRIISPYKALIDQVPTALAFYQGSARYVFLAK